MAIKSTTGKPAGKTPSKTTPKKPAPRPAKPRYGAAATLPIVKRYVTDLVKSTAKRVGWVLVPSPFDRLLVKREIKPATGAQIKLAQVRSAFTLSSATGPCPCRLTVCCATYIAFLPTGFVKMWACTCP